MATNMVRQGDVLVVRVDSLPEKAEPKPRKGGRVVLAHGEATGHAHAIEEPWARLFEDGASLYLRADEGVTLRHEEHAAIALDPGTYRVIRQREYTGRGGWADVND